MFTTTLRESYETVDTLVEIDDRRPCVRRTETAGGRLRNWKWRVDVGFAACAREKKKITNIFTISSGRSESVLRWKRTTRGQRRVRVGDKARRLWRAGVCVPLPETMRSARRRSANCGDGSAAGLKFDADDPQTVPRVHSGGTTTERPQTRNWRPSRTIRQIVSDGFFFRFSIKSFNRMHSRPRRFRGPPPPPQTRVEVVGA